MRIEKIKNNLLVVIQTSVENENIINYCITIFNKNNLDTVLKRIVNTSILATNEIDFINCLIDNLNFEYIEKVNELINKINGIKFPYFKESKNINLYRLENCLNSNNLYYINDTLNIANIYIELENLNGQHFDTINKYNFTDEFLSEYNRIVNNVKSSGQVEGQIDILHIINEIYKFEICAFNRKQTFNFDFEKNKKVDFRKKEYKELLKKEVY